MEATMFNRIRYAAHVLAYSATKTDRYSQPDIVFVEQREHEVSKASRAVANFVGFLAVALAFGSLSAFIFKLIPLHTAENSAVAVGVVAVVMAQFWNLIYQNIEGHLHRTLRVGDRIAPFVGHKITKAIDTLRS